MPVDDAPQAEVVFAPLGAPPGMVHALRARRVPGDPPDALQSVWLRYRGVHRLVLVRRPAVQHDQPLAVGGIDYPALPAVVDGWNLFLAGPDPGLAGVRASSWPVAIGALLGYFKGLVDASIGSAPLYLTRQEIVAAGRAPRPS